MHTAAHATQTAAGAGGPLPYWAPPSHPAVPPGPARHGAPQMPPTESWTHAGQRDWTRYHDAPAMVPPSYAVPRQTDSPAPADPVPLATVTPATGDTAADTRRPRSRRRERSRTHSAVSSGRYNPPRSRRRRHRSGSAGDSPDAPPASRARVSNDHPAPVQHRARHVRSRRSSSSSSSAPRYDSDTSTGTTGRSSSCGSPEPARRRPRAQRRAPRSSTYTATRGTRAGFTSDPGAALAGIPTTSPLPPPPPELGLPPLPRRATKQLRRRDRFTAVTDALQPGEPAPTTVAGYTAKVAQLIAHATYYFPDAGTQYAVYMAWLLERAQNRTIAYVTTLDTQARSQMAQTPHIFFTPTTLQHYVLSAEATTRVTAPSHRAPGFTATASQGAAEICELHNVRRCAPGPCPRRRRHVCAVCESPAHRRRECPLPAARQGR